MTWRRFALFVMTLVFAGPANAEPAAERPSAVATFETLCLAGSLDPAARATAVAAAGWTPQEPATLDIAKLAVSRAIEVNYDFSKPESVRQWRGVVDGQPAVIVLADFPAKRRYPHLCALVIDGIENAMPYGADLRNAFGRLGIKAKSVDLVHYYEFAGKIGAGKQPVRGEIFSRSLASGNPRSMHIYVAY